MIKIALAGDIFITRTIPDVGYYGLDEIINLLNKHDIKFANLETTIHDRKGYPSAFPGGTWAMAMPDCLSSIKSFGFNILNTANNHSMDYSYGGMMATLDILKKYDIKYAGTGKNLQQACAPVYIECSGYRIAMIGATSSFHDSDAAGNSRMDIQGRPGVNPLRHKSVYEITSENYKHLKRIAKETGINSYHNQAIKEGYLRQRENFNFGNAEFVEGEKNTLHTFPLEKDMLRIKKSIMEAKEQSDFVIVSIHSHQFSFDNKKYPAEFIRLFSKSCIDSGASIIVGHGPHVLRGIEAYKQGLIFYGLGNFIFQNETMTHLPADFFEKYDVPNSACVDEAFDKRTKNGTIGLNVDENAWQGLMVSMEVDNKLNAKLYPIELGFNLPRNKKGWPVISENMLILKQVRELSLLYETEIEIVNGVGIVKQYE